MQPDEPPPLIGHGAANCDERVLPLFEASANEQKHCLKDTLFGLRYRHEHRRASTSAQQRKTQNH
jgi:hypothetical protein